MLFFPFRLLNTLTGRVCSGVGTIVTLLMLFGYVYHSQQVPHFAAPRPVPLALSTAINDLCQNVPPMLPEPNRALRPTLLLPLASDREGIFTEGLRTSLDSHGWYRTTEASLSSKAWELVGFGADPSQSMQFSAVELAKMMQSAKAEAALRGSVDRLALPPDAPVEIKLRLELWELTDSNTAVLLRSLDLERPESVAVATVADAPKPSRGTCFWSYTIILIIGLAYPFAMIPWMRKAIREDSNEAILMALLGMTAIPVIALLVYLIWQGSSSFDIAIQSGMVALFLFFYTAFVLDRIQKNGQ
jgi:hypothetical protein